jgi:hypothetical protein
MGLFITFVPLQHMEEFKKTKEKLLYSFPLPRQCDRNRPAFEVLEVMKEPTVQSEVKRQILSVVKNGHCVSLVSVLVLVFIS